MCMCHGVMKMRNITPRLGLEPTSLAYHHHIQVYLSMYLFIISNSINRSIKRLGQVLQYNLTFQKDRPHHILKWLLELQLKRLVLDVRSSDYLNTPGLLRVVVWCQTRPALTRLNTKHAQPFSTLKALCICLGDHGNRKYIYHKPILIYQTAYSKSIPANQWL